MAARAAVSPPRSSYSAGSPVRTGHPPVPADSAGGGRQAILVRFVGCPAEIIVKLSILMPVYNEETRVATAVKQALNVDYPCEVELLIVDDGSGDGTAEILARLDDPRGRVIVHPRNRGKGAAIQTAVDNATGDYMVIFDADLEYDPQDILVLLEPMLDGRATVVYGNRSFGSHSSFSFWYVMGNKAVTMAAN